MLLATPSLLINPNERQALFNYDENSINTSKDLTKNSVNSSSSSISECSSESPPPRPLSSCSPLLSAHIENNYTSQTNLQKKSNKFLNHHLNNARYQAMPYYNNMKSNNEPNKHSYTVANNTLTIPYQSNNTEIQCQNYVAYNQQYEYQNNNIESFNQISHNPQYFQSSYQGCFDQQSMIGGSYQNEHNNNNEAMMMMGQCYPSFSNLGYSGSSNGSPCIINQIPESKLAIKLF